MIKDHTLHSWMPQVPKNKSISGGIFVSGKNPGESWSTAHTPDSLAAAFQPGGPELPASDMRGISKKGEMFSDRINIGYIDGDEGSNIKYTKWGRSLELPISDEEVVRIADHFTTAKGIPYERLVLHSSSVMYDRLPARRVGFHVIWPLAKNVTRDKLKAFIGSKADWLDGEFSQNIAYINSAGEPRTDKNRVLFDMSVYSGSRAMHSSFHTDDPTILYSEGKAMTDASWKKIHPLQLDKLVTYTDEDIKLQQAVKAAEQGVSEDAYKKKRAEHKAMTRHGTISSSHKVYDGDKYIGTIGEIDKRMGKTNFNAIDSDRPEKGASWAPGGNAGMVQDRSADLTYTIVYPKEEAILYDSRYAPFPEETPFGKVAVLSDTNSGKSHWIANIHAPFLLKAFDRVFITEPTLTAAHNMYTELKKAEPELAKLGYTVRYLVSGKDKASEAEKGSICVMTIDKLYGSVIKGSMDVTDDAVLIDEAHEPYKSHTQLVKKQRFVDDMMRGEVGVGHLTALSGTLESEILPAIVDGGDWTVLRFERITKKPVTFTDVFPLRALGKGTHIFTRTRKDVLHMVDHLTLFSSLRIGYVLGKVTDRDLLRYETSEGTFLAEIPPELYGHYDILVTNLALGVGSSLPETYTTSIIDARGLSAQEIKQADRVRAENANLFIYSGYEPFKKDPIRLLTTKLAKSLKDDITTVRNYNLIDYHNGNSRIVASKQVVNAEYRALSTLEEDDFGVRCYIRHNNSMRILSNAELFEEQFYHWGSEILFDLHPDLIREDWAHLNHLEAAASAFPYWYDDLEDNEGEQLKLEVDNLMNPAQVNSFIYEEPRSVLHEEAQNKIKKRYPIRKDIRIPGSKHAVEISDEYKAKSVTHAPTQDKLNKQEKLNVWLYENDERSVRVGKVLNDDEVYGIQGLVNKARKIVGDIAFEVISDRKEAYQMIKDYGRLTFYRTDGAPGNNYTASVTAFSFKFGWFEMIDILKIHNKPAMTA